MNQEGQTELQTDVIESAERIASPTESFVLDGAPRVGLHDGLYFDVGFQGDRCLLEITVAHSTTNITASIIAGSPPENLRFRIVTSTSM